jgi:glyoxylase I family protein
MEHPHFIDHLVFRVLDLNKTRDFYNVVLGREPTGGEESLMYRVGDTRVFFTLCQDGTKAAFEKENVGLNHLAFGVRTLEELETIRKRLDEARLKHSGIKQDPYGLKDFIWLDDPDGMRIEFYCRPVA